MGEGRTASLGLADQTIIYRMDKQQGPLYSTGKYSQYSVINHNENEYVYMHN